MPCGCTENKNLNKDKLSLESMQALSIDEIINLYRQGYILEESEDFTDIRSLALASPQFQYAMAVEGVPSSGKIRIAWIWSNTSSYGYGQFKFYDYTTGVEIGAMPSSCYDPGPSQLYRLSTYDINYTTAPSDIRIIAYKCNSDTQQSCPAGTCSAPVESSRIYTALIPPGVMVPPSTPSTLTITPGNGSLTFSWSAVSNTPMLGYHIVVKMGVATVIDGYWSQNEGPITISGLTNGTSYTVSVNAVSASGAEGTARTGSGTPSLPTPVLTTIAITPITASVNVGATQQLTAVCKDQNGTVMTCPTLTWLSSDTTKATVSSSGLVTGVATGSANITAGASGVTSNTSAITIISTIPVLTTIAITPTTASVNVGATQQLTAVCKDQNGTVMTCPTLTWVSSNVAKATVSSSGLVIGVATGSANITASASGVMSNASAITVNAPSQILGTISITPPSQSINTGSTIQLTAVCKDTGGITMMCPTLTWVSNNTSKVTVNSSGLVTGVAAGSANITASASGVTSNSSTITVTGIVSTLTSIVVSPTNASIGIGGTRQLTAVCKDQFNTTMACPTLAWVSNNTAKATVNSSGLVTGVVEGTANVTASASGVTSNVSAITVTTTPPPQEAGGGAIVIAAVALVAAMMFMSRKPPTPPV